VHGHRVLHFSKVTYLLMEKIYNSRSKIRHLVDIFDRLSCLQGNILPYFYTVFVTDPLRTNYDNDRSLGILIEYLGGFCTLSEWLQSPERPHDYFRSDEEIKNELKATLLRTVKMVHSQGIIHGNLCDTSVLICKESLSITLVNIKLARVSNDTKGDDKAMKSIFEQIEQARF
jgi:tRNA A-37 threonylcarbamoyl transferase component Bud32